MKRFFSLLLAVCLCLSVCALPALAAAPVVARSAQSFSVDGSPVNAEIYNIDGYNYFKLRDIAMLLRDTSARFSVDYQDGVISVTTGAAYTPVGGELVIGADRSGSCVPGNEFLMIDGREYYLTAYNLGGNNFFKLRDLGDALGFYVGYREETDTAFVASAYYIRHTDVDTERYYVLMSYEIPVFYGDGAGLRSINAYFQDLETDFVSSEWNGVRDLVVDNPYGPSAEFPYYDEWSADVCTYDDSLISTTVSYFWNMGGVNDYGINGYTFNVRTGAQLRLNDVLDASDSRIKDAIAAALLEQYPDIENAGMMGETPITAMRAMDVRDMDFFVVDHDYVVVVFDKYEISFGAAGMFTAELRSLPLKTI